MRTSQCFLAAMCLLALCVPQRLSAEQAANVYADFLKRVADEVRVFQKVREIDTPPPRPDPVDMLLDEIRVQRAVSARQAPTAAPSAARSATAEQTSGQRSDLEAPVESLQAELAARELVESEHRRDAEMLAERTGRLIAAAKEHVRVGRLDAAERALLTALREDPRNLVAARLLAQVRTERADTDTRRLTAANERESAAAFRAMDAARVPLSNTLTYPKDWAKRSAKAEAALAAAAKDAAPAADAAVRKALTKKMSIDAIELPLSDAASFIRNVAGVNIALDKDAEQKTVTLQLRDVPVSAALDWITTLTNLKYRIRGGCVHIGPAERLAEESVVRIYDVSDLLHVRQLLSRGRNMRRAVQLGGIIRDDNDNINPFEEDVKVPTLVELAEDLIEFLKTATGPTEWDDLGKARMDIRLGRLVVNAEPSLQLKILEIIDGLRE